MEFEYNRVIISLPNTTEEAYEQIRERLENNVESALLESDMKNREAIKDAFEYALQKAPEENASDIWHHIIYRGYLEFYQDIRGHASSPKQSWVRASGDALELFFVEYYNEKLPSDIRMTALFGSSERKALEVMGIEDMVGDAKLDITIEGKIDHDWYIFGGSHAKASLAERITDDVPASEVMMDNGFLSVLQTMDVKSFPPPQGEYVNNGEFGEPQDPSEKRRYVEDMGQFSDVYAYNERTTPSPEQTASGSCIYYVPIPSEEDQFVRDCRSFWNTFKSKDEVQDHRVPRDLDWNNQRS